MINCTSESYLQRETIYIYIYTRPLASALSPVPLLRTLQSRAKSTGQKALGTAVPEKKQSTEFRARCSPLALKLFP